MRNVYLTIARIAARFLGRKALYLVTRQSYVDGAIVEPFMFSGPPLGVAKITKATIQFSGLPSKAMRPINWQAFVIWHLHERSFPPYAPSEEMKRWVAAGSPTNSVPLYVASVDRAARRRRMYNHPTSVGALENVAKRHGARLSASSQETFSAHMGPAGNAIT